MMFDPQYYKPPQTAMKRYGPEDLPDLQSHRSRGMEGLRKERREWFLGKMRDMEIENSKERENYFLGPESPQLLRQPRPINYRAWYTQPEASGRDREVEVNSRDFEKLYQAEDWAESATNRRDAFYALKVEIEDKDGNIVGEYKANFDFDELRAELKKRRLQGLVSV